MPSTVNNSINKYDNREFRTRYRNSISNFKMLDILLSLVNFTLLYFY